MRDRTADPLLAKQVLSQLSYTPMPSRVGTFHLRAGPSKLNTIECEFHLSETEKSSFPVSSDSLERR